MTFSKINTSARALLLVLAAASIPAFGQVDLSGSWAARNHEDLLERMAGPFAVDYTGLPLNPGGRARALSYSPAQLSEPERVCAFYPPFYIMLGPFGLKIWNETDKLTGATIAWHIGGWEDRAPTTIWMDGRPHPSRYAPHTKSGFTTGEWDGDVLTTYTTHMKAGYIRRNGAPSSDRATMTAHFFRHGDLLTLAASIEDPVDLAEPLFMSRSYILEPEPIDAMGPPCIQGDEGLKDGEVPHYLPGKNPFIGEVTKIYHIPQDAVLGGPQTMYPEFRKKLKGEYVAPEKCLRNCGGPGATGRFGEQPRPN
jgi:hypothetical protein